jgi:hypothetical protein
MIADKELNKEFTTFYLLGGASRNEIVPAIDEIYYNGKNRKIRYIRGFPTIFADEQGFDNDLEGDKRVETIVFESGSKVVQKTEATLLKYLTLCNYNQNRDDSNGERMANSQVLFLELDTARKSKELEVDIDLEHEVMGMVMEMDFDELKMIYAVTCKNASQRNALSTMELSEVSHAVKARVKQDHKWVLKQIQDPVNKRKVFIIKAEQEGVIEINKTDNSIYYTSSKDSSPFFRAGEGLDPINELAMAYERNQDIKNIIRDIKESVSIIEDKKVEAAVKDVSAEKIDELATKKAKEILDELDWRDGVIKSGLNNGSITLKSSWYYLHFECDGVVVPEKINGKKTIKEFISDNPSVVPILVSKE